VCEEISDDLLSRKTCPVCFGRLTIKSNQRTLTQAYETTSTSGGLPPKGEMLGVDAGMLVFLCSTHSIQCFAIISRVEYHLFLQTHIVPHFEQLVAEILAWWASLAGKTSSSGEGIRTT
jgi:hypothetical protein